MVGQGDIFFVDFTPSQGHEQMSRRPALALSNNLVAKTSGMTIVAPISSTRRRFPMYYPLGLANKVHGQVLLDQTRALDLRARKIRDSDIVDHLSKDELEAVVKLYQLLFSLDD